MKISGFSTARYSTWYFLDQYKVLFDAGDGAAASLGPRCQNIQHVFLSHADRDHLGGLLALNHLGARADNPLRFYYPKDSSSFSDLLDFIERFDASLPKSIWMPVEAGMRIKIDQQHVVEIGENDHIAMATGNSTKQVKSLDFSLIERRKHLRAEFQGLGSDELKHLRALHGDTHITESVDYRLFGFSGDTPSFKTEQWRGTEVLIHEATFIAPDHGNRGHCELGDVLQAAGGLNLKALIVGHFSDRYDPEFIKASIRRLARELAFDVPVFAVMPRVTQLDILSSEPVWQGICP
ncbi:MAG: hypothetical protein AAFW82_06950 [Pseudomonadota bacterium]